MCSFLGSILFNLPIKDLFFFTEKAFIHNFADDKNISDLIAILESESRVAIDWLTKNKMIINHEKFQAIDLDKNKSYHSRKPSIINNQKIKTVSSEELLGIQLDFRLIFNNNVNNVCRPAANQLNALIRLNPFAPMHLFSTP